MRGGSVGGWFTLLYSGGESKPAWRNLLKKNKKNKKKCVLSVTEKIFRCALASTKKKNHLWCALLTSSWSSNTPSIHLDDSPNVADWVRIGACISTELIRGMSPANDKAGCLCTLSVIFPAVPKWHPFHPCHHREPRTPTNGSAAVKEIGNTWRLASSNGASVTLIYAESNIDRWMFVATGLRWRCLS